MKFHLKNDLYINKQSIKNSFSNQYGWLDADDLADRGLDSVRSLLEKRTQSYTKEEVETLLLSAWWTSHDECVADEGTDDPLEQYRFEQKVEAINYALDIIESDEEI